MRCRAHADTAHLGDEEDMTSTSLKEVEKV